MLAGAFSCHHLNAHRNDEYIVPEASDGDVTDTACPGRILLVEQQVSLSLLIRDRNRHTSDFPRRTIPAYRRLTILLKLRGWARIITQVFCVTLRFIGFGIWRAILGGNVF